MASSGGGHKGVHLLAVPNHDQGHIIPLLRFTTDLARAGITVSFMCDEDAVPQLAASPGEDSAESEPTSLDSFQFVKVSNPRSRRRGKPGGKREFQEACEPYFKKLVSEKRAGVSDGPTCVIADYSLLFPLDAAEELQIPSYTFVPSGAIFVRFLQGVIELFENGKLQISNRDGKLIEPDEPICISGLPAQRYDQLGNNIRSKPSEYLATAKYAMKSTGVVVNSFLELEEMVVEILRNSGHPANESGKVPKVYPVGPGFSTKVVTDSIRAGKGLEDSGSKCLDWLASQPASSVLYVAFGSRINLGREEITELAYGLEASDQRFLWVIPQPENSSVSDVLPPGFEARVGNRCCIVTGWAPQLQVLAHPSTSGFFSHAGWNSCLESAAFGVPMLMLPNAAEQHLNCRYYVEDLKVAVELETGEGHSVKRSEVERKVRLLMVESEGAAMRSRMQEIQKKAEAATAAEGGSKSRIIQEFVDDICGIDK